MQTWNLIKLPLVAKVITSIWILLRKFHGIGIKHKARLSAQGDKQSQNNNLYYLQEGDKIVILVLYVDDLFRTRTHQDKIS